VIGYTPAELAIRAGHGDPYATGRDDNPDARDDAPDTKAVA
jgi:hypothetical protein